MRSSIHLLTTAGLAGLLAACNAIAGLDDYTFDQDASAGGPGAGGASAGAGGSEATGGTGGGAGEGGASSGTGGVAGEGGAAGSGGQGGTAGAAGQGGVAGLGGAAGQSGAAGQAGTGGQSGSSGSAGAAGTAGSSGAAGAGGAPPTCTVSNERTCNGKALTSCLTGAPVVDETCSGRESCDPVLGCVKPTSIYAGRRHACAILADTTAVCWGANDQGQLGRKTTTPKDGELPARVLTTATEDTPLRNVKQLALGDTFTCALVDDNDEQLGVWCWGADNMGQLGDGAALSPRLAVDLKFPIALGQRKPLVTPGMTTLAASGNTACVVTTTAGVFCWGDGTSRQLANAANSAGEPVKINGVENATTVAVGGPHVCATVDMNVSGRVKCWGARDSGQLGDGVVDVSPQQTPQYVTIQIGNLQLVANATSTLVAQGGDVGGGATENIGSSCLLRDGRPYCWGSGHLGQMGNGQFVDRPRAIAPADVGGSAIAKATLTSLTMGGGHVCARDGAAHTYCWGMNFSGELGVPTPAQQNSPLDVPLQGASVVGGGYLYAVKDPVDQTSYLTQSRGFSCVLQLNGQVICVGNNTTRQLGVPANAPPRTAITMP